MSVSVRFYLKVLLATENELDLWIKKGCFRDEAPSVVFVFCVLLFFYVRLIFLNGNILAALKFNMVFGLL